MCDLILKPLLQTGDKTVQKSTIQRVQSLGFNFQCMGKSIKKKHFSFRKRKNKLRKLNVAKKGSLTKSRLSLQNLQEATHRKMKVVSRLPRSLQHHPAIPPTRYHFPLPSACPFPKLITGLTTALEKCLTDPILLRFPSCQ